MNSNLAEFLGESAGRDFAWGARDCGLWLADWVVAERGIPDPAAALRGRYGDRAAAHAALGRFGLALVVARLARAAGLARTQDPMPGDIAVIALPPKIGPTGTIRGRYGWVVLAAGRGLIRIAEASNPRVLAMWRV